MRTDHCQMSEAFRPTPRLYVGMHARQQTEPLLVHQAKQAEASAPYVKEFEGLNPYPSHPSPGGPATSKPLRRGGHDPVQTQPSLKASASSLESYLKQIKQFPVLSQEEEFGLAVRYRKENDMGAARKLIESNLRFVVRVALEFRFYGIKISDLIQEGNIGLIMALRKFDPYKGFRFVSYAVWWVRACIQNFIMKNWSLVKIGTTQAERKLFYKIGKVRKALQADPEDASRYETLARDFDVAKEDIIEMEQRMASRDYSMDSPLNDAQETTPYNLFESHSPDQEEILGQEEERQILRKEIREAMRQLSKKEEYVLRNRRMAEFPHTLQEIGDHLHLSRERVRQIESEALKKLKKELIPRINWLS